ncbi:YbhB/YbcL family Raf kinase inhibitor-like protein [Geobacter sp. AOG2]|uniref:YbhB/YbcL family Raf kinase inhibitor-like protein n=1 Tax=Geobacter sp. AOG2 TaxID=1566347 RepID=UPI001CC3F73A|nr:YbhB/YbcL family Raf kinase inhibitor-like protein [Geobacter sp. AOG2]
MKRLTMALLPAVFWVLLYAAAEGKEIRRMETLTITSPGFSQGGAIPARHTCDGNDTSPSLIIAKVPSTAQSLALIMDDPDAPMGDWVHWVVWNIPPRTWEIPENSLPPQAVQGKNDWHRTGYGGPCPPSGTHRYFFRVYALDITLHLGNSTTKGDLERAMQGHILGKGELMGTYKRR